MLQLRLRLLLQLRLMLQLRLLLLLLQLRIGIVARRGLITSVLLRCRRVVREVVIVLHCSFSAVIRAGRSLAPRLARASTHPGE